MDQVDPAGHRCQGRCDIELTLVIREGQGDEQEGAPEGTLLRWVCPGPWEPAGKSLKAPDAGSLGALVTPGSCGGGNVEAT